MHSEVKKHTAAKQDNMKPLERGELSHAANDMLSRVEQLCKWHWRISTPDNFHSCVQEASGITVAKAWARCGQQAPERKPTHIVGFFFNSHLWVVLDAASLPRPSSHTLDVSNKTFCCVLFTVLGPIISPNSQTMHHKCSGPTHWSKRSNVTPPLRSHWTQSVVHSAHPSSPWHCRNYYFIWKQFHSREVIRKMFVILTDATDAKEPCWAAAPLWRRP